MCQGVQGVGDGAVKRGKAPSAQNVLGKFSSVLLLGPTASKYQRGTRPQDFLPHCPVFFCSPQGLSTWAGSWRVQQHVSPCTQELT